MTIYYYHLGPNNKSNNSYFKDITNDKFVTNWEKNFKNNPDNVLAEFEQSWLSKEHSPVVFISAQEKTNIDMLRQKILQMIS